MRMMKKGGVAPCDRRLDRRKVAIAAAAVLFLTATAVRADIVDFVIDTSQSSLKQGNTIFGPAVGVQKSLAQDNPALGGSGLNIADTVPLYGHLSVDLVPGTIQLMPGTMQSGGSNIVVGNTGNWIPFDPNTNDDPNNGNPSTPGQPFPVAAAAYGLTSPGQWGLAIPGVGAWSVEQFEVLTFGAPVQTGLPLGVPSTPMALAGNNFNLSGQAMSFNQGRQAFVSALGDNAGDNVGFPSLFGTSAPDVGTWDGTTLTIPVHSTVTFTITSSFGGIQETVTITGQIVAHPYVPEPSTMTLLGFGVVGLLSYAWRARKRKA